MACNRKGMLREGWVVSAGSIKRTSRSVKQYFASSRAILETRGGGLV
jgi:hypothetical protein